MLPLKFHVNDDGLRMLGQRRDGEYSSSADNGTRPKLSGRSFDERARVSVPPT
jgi:hypothetical protein